jgi:hypothetical protein
MYRASDGDFTNTSSFSDQIIDIFKYKERQVMMAVFVFAGMIVVVTGGLFGAYTLGFYDGVKDGERLGAVTNNRTN